MEDNNCLDVHQLKKTFLSFDLNREPGLKGSKKGEEKADQMELKYVEQVLRGFIATTQVQAVPDFERTAKMIEKEAMANKSEIMPIPCM